MENGGTGSSNDELAYKLSGLSVNDNNNDEISQIFNAVQIAEATIKQQVEENDRLRSELLKKNHELEKYLWQKVDHLKNQSFQSVVNWDHRSHEPPVAHRPISDLANQTNGDISIHNSTHEPSDTLGLAEEATHLVEDPKIPFHVKSSESEMVTSNDAGFSQFLSPSISPFSPSRNQMEGEYDAQFSVSSHGLMPMSNSNNPNTPLKQNLLIKIQEHENEILQLKKHLAEFSVKEEQIRHEKYVLEKGIAYMRMAFDQQQQELIDAASKAIAYRQDIIEENIRLSYALQEAQQERSTFISSLMPVIAEYSSQQPDTDAQSIVSNLKVLFKHLQERLIITEAKLKESQYQMASWLPGSNFTSSASPSHSLGNNKLDLVPQPIYSNQQSPMSSDPIPSKDRYNLMGNQQSVLAGAIVKNLEADNLERSPVGSRSSQGIPPQQDAARQVDFRHHNLEMTSKQVTFSDNVSSIDMNEPDVEGHQIGRDPSANWVPPYLSPVPEEPSSSFSEAADDDLLPAVEGLQISGEAFPGRELQASGYSINGTTSCNFEWVRHLEDGSVNYIDGAKQPNYLVCADDVDTYLAIEVQPMDDRKRKGELVKVFANEHRKITCDSEMQNFIKNTLRAGQASYRISVSVGYLDLWEPATLAIKREGFSIRNTGTNPGVVTEKFSPATMVTVPCGNPTEFFITGAGGVEHILQAENSPEDIIGSRDTIVLTLRLFIRRAGEKKKGKRKLLIFNK